MCVFGDEHFGYGQCLDGAVGWRGMETMDTEAIWFMESGVLVIRDMNMAWVYEYRR